MKLLVTGVNGFVAKHFLNFLAANDPGFEITGLGRAASPSFHIPAGLNFKYIAGDLLEKEKVGKILTEVRPDFLLHLASVSSVGHSWKQPHESFVNNTNIFLNLVDQIRLQKIPCKIVSVGSSEEYGNVSKGNLPLTEDSPLDPISPYAVARVSQEMISRIYNDGFGIDIIMTRSFNHIGPGQTDAFVISSFAKQLVRIASTPEKSGKVITGNLSIIRDFVDVRDVVRAYYILLKKGNPGDIFNICSGTGTSLGEVLKMMCNILNIRITTEEDPSLVRPNDNMIITGSNKRIFDKVGWKPEIPLKQSLRDIIDWYR